MATKFYMQRYDVARDKVDLQTHFEGLMYVEAKGLSDKGKPKNIVTEKFADSAEDKVYIPENVYYEPNEITLSFVFKGSTRRDVYDAFCNYIKQGKFYYWDTERLRKVNLILLSPIKVSDDVFKGSMPYIKVDYVFTNLLGESKKVDVDGNLV